MKERQQEKKNLLLWKCLKIMPHGTMKFQIAFWALRPTSTKKTGSLLFLSWNPEVLWIFFNLPWTDSSFWIWIFFQIPRPGDSLILKFFKHHNWYGSLILNFSNTQNHWVLKSNTRLTQESYLSSWKTQGSGFGLRRKRQQTQKGMMGISWRQKKTWTNL